MMPANEYLYDLSEIKLISNNDDGLLNKILSILVSMLSSEKENIRVLAKSNNWKEVSEIVHKLKTSLTHIQANSLKQIILDLEDYESHTNEKLSLLAEEFCNGLDNILVYLEVDLAASAKV
jgi:HPt (histidine-containing phosphotransfer) domain-containing protein